MNGMGGGVTRVGTRMAPAADGRGTARTTFAVGRLTSTRSEIRLVQLRGSRRRAGTEGDETVH